MSINIYDLDSEDDDDISLPVFSTRHTSKPNKSALTDISELREELNNIDAKFEEETEKVYRNIFSEDNNIFSNDRAKTMFMEEICGDGDYNILTSPISTMITITGELENVSVDEKNPFVFHYNDEIIAILSNFGELINPKYGIGKIQKKKSGRGRKKEEKKPKKERVMQGNGKYFQSQITMVYMCRELLDPKTVHGYKEYKFKIFKGKNGKAVIHIPGATPETIKNVLDGCQAVVDLINEVFHKDENNPEKLARIIGLYPCTKNYKFYLKMDKGKIIDFMLLKKIFTVHKTGKIYHRCDEEKCKECDDEIILKKYVNLEDMELLTDIPPHPQIFNVIYTGEENTTLFIEFLTPEITEDKKIRVNFYPGKEIPRNYAPGIEPDAYGGKINILGGHKEEVTREIYNYLLYIFEVYYDYLITKPEINRIDEYCYVEWYPPQNIINWQTEEEMWKYAIANN